VAATIVALCAIIAREMRMRTRVMIVYVYNRLDANLKTNVIQEILFNEKRVTYNECEVDSQAVDQNETQKKTMNRSWRGRKSKMLGT